MRLRRWPQAPITGMLGTELTRRSTRPAMTVSTQTAAKPRIAPAGLMFLAITSVGWGFNWPVTKYLLGELPPLTLRGVTGVIGALLLAAARAGARPEPEGRAARCGRG